MLNNQPGYAMQATNQTAKRFFCLKKVENNGFEGFIANKQTNHV